jgi:spore germination cell wall hydrolase CwlJ-like protein
MLAAGAVAVMISGLAVGHVAAQPGPEQTVAPAVAPAPPVIEIAPPEALVPEPDPVPEIDPRHVACVAKVVHHEAGNQPRKGQIAVAHVMINRVKHGFAADVCAVANQPGQFFRLSRYHPNRNSPTWAAAVDVARAVLAGEARDHSKGALFFHANWAKPDRFFRTRTKLATLEDHDFYR